MGGNNWDTVPKAKVEQAPPPPDPPQLLFRYARLGGHIHVDCLQGKGPGYTWEKNGTLVFDEAGWGAFKHLQPSAGCIVRWENDTPAAETSDPIGGRAAVMGYTHFWYYKPIPTSTWAKIAADASTILAVVQSEGGVQLAFDYDSPAPPEVSSACIHFNGAKGTGCETFSFDRKPNRHGQKDARGLTFDFCKTEHRPYDIAVMCILIIALHHIGSRFFRVSSNGDEAEWEPARDLCQRTLGYGAAFSITAEELRAEEDAR